MIEGRDGSELRIVRSGAETGGELLEIEASYPGTGGMPPEHLHPRQAESFEVLEGSLRTEIDGVEARYGAGESFEVPAGTPHRMGSDIPTRFRWRVRPALRTAEFFERLHGSGPGSAEDAASPAEFLAAFSGEIRFTGR